MTATPTFDEMWGRDGTLRAPYARFNEWLDGEDPKRLRAKSREAEELFRLTGITFTVYGRAEAEEQLIPFDIIPRVISGPEWQKLSRGITRRVQAINAFLHDICHRQEIVRAGCCSEPDSRAYVLDHLDELVVKEAHGSGGYVMLIGPTSTKKDLAAFRRKLKAWPANYIAQPTLSLSTVPIFTPRGAEPAPC